MKGFKVSFLEFEDDDVILRGKSAIPNKFWDCLKFRRNFDKSIKIDGDSTVSLLNVHFGFGGELGVDVRAEEFTKDFGFVFGSDLLGVLIGIDVEANFGLCGVLTGKGFVGTSFFAVHGRGLGKIVFGKAWVSVELDNEFGCQGGTVE